MAELSMLMHPQDCAAKRVSPLAPLPSPATPLCR